MRTQIWIAALAAAALALGAASSATASPLIRADHLSSGAREGAVLVHHKPGHVMKHANRGRHLGWTRGKHRGWTKSR
jgi:hypothetical protein